MKYKVFLAVGSEEIEKKISKISDIEIVDTEDDLVTLQNLIEYLDVKYLIINRLLDNGNSVLLDVAKKAREKNIKIILLMDNLESFEEKKLIGALVNYEVYSYLDISNFQEEQLMEVLKNYPKEFSFDLLSKPKVVEKIVEVPKIITKEVTITKEVLSNATISLISNCSTGKSFIAWNLAYCFSKMGYKTSVLNLDRAYSANIFYGIDNGVDGALKNISSRQNIYDFINDAYVINKNLKVITNNLCSKEEIPNDCFLKVLNTVRSKSDITIIDLKSRMDDNLRTALAYSNIILFVFDIDYMHFSLNIELLNEICNEINFKRTIAVLNNVFPGSKEIKNIESYIRKIDKDLKNIVSIRNCGSVAYDTMFTGTCPYFETENDGFKKDIDNLMERMSARKEETFLDKLLKKF